MLSFFYENVVLTFSKHCSLAGYNSIWVVEFYRTAPRKIRGVGAIIIRVGIVLGNFLKAFATTTNAIAIGRRCCTIFKYCQVQVCIITAIGTITRTAHYADLGISGNSNPIFYRGRD